MFAWRSLYPQPPQWVNFVGTRCNDPTVQSAASAATKQQKLTDSCACVCVRARGVWYVWGRAT
jgi:hypothetical protein